MCVKVKRMKRMLTRNVALCNADKECWVVQVSLSNQEGLGKAPDFEAFQENKKLKFPA